MTTLDFPWPCVDCKKDTVWPAEVSHKVQFKHENTTHEISIENLPVNKCSSCSEIMGTPEGSRMIEKAMRKHLRVLSAEQIRAKRQSLNLTQEAVAQACGFAPSAISKWESGVMIQSRATDRMLRVFCRFPEVRDYLANLDSELSLETLRGEESGDVVGHNMLSGQNSPPWQSDASLECERQQVSPVVSPTGVLKHGVQMFGLAA